MKLAISIPDPLHEAAERAARRMRVPRSQFYARAVAAYLKQDKDAEVTARLNEVYGAEVSVRDEFLEQAARATLKRSRW
jgi:metal-responsive CopG/Arc/MetJ family transcriptional regulator